MKFRTFEKLVFVAAILFTQAASAKVRIPFKSMKLKSGLELITVEDHKVGLVTIVLAAKAGAMTETPETDGLTHLWEHMFFKGNATIPDQEAYKRRVRQLGITYNGDTAAEKVRYYFTMPAAFLNDGLKFMYDAIATPLLNEKELQKERRVVLNEYDRFAAQPSFDSNRLTRKIIYGNLDYLRDPLGKRELIASATRKQLLKIKDEVFTPSNSALLVSGSFDTKQLRKSVKRIFANWKNPKGWTRPKRQPFLPFPKTTEYTMARPNVQNAQVLMTFQGPRARLQPKDTFDADVLTSLLSLRSGKFYKKFVDSGRALNAGMYYHTQNQTGEIVVYGITTHDKIAKLGQELRAEIKLWAKPNYFTKEQLANVQRSLLIGHKRELAKPSEFIKTLAFWWAVTGLDYYRTYIPNLRLVDLKAVQAFTRKYLVDKPYVAARLVSPEQAKKHKIPVDSQKLAKKYLGI